VYEWSHKGNGIYPPTYEVAKIIVANGELYRLSYDKYTEKLDDDDVVKLKEYIKNLKIKLSATVHFTALVFCYII
jgi:hypothetical protein